MFNVFKNLSSGSMHRDWPARYIREFMTKQKNLTVFTKYITQ